MKAFVGAIVAMVVIGIGSSMVLDSSFQKTSEASFATSGVRLEAHSSH